MRLKRDLCCLLAGVIFTTAAFTILSFISELRQANEPTPPRAQNLILLMSRLKELNLDIFVETLDYVNQDSMEWVFSGKQLSGPLLDEGRVVRFRDGSAISCAVYGGRYYFYYSDYAWGSDSEFLARFTKRISRPRSKSNHTDRL